MTLFAALLLRYAIGLITLGIWAGRSVRHTSDFFVAGRSLGPGLIFATFLAANLGAGTTVGFAGATDVMHTDVESVAVTLERLREPPKLRVPFEYQHALAFA